MKRSTAEAIWRGRRWTGDKPGWPHAAMDGAPARRGLAPPPLLHAGIAIGCMQPWRLLHALVIWCAQAGLIWAPLPASSLILRFNMWCRETSAYGWKEF